MSTTEVFNASQVKSVMSEIESEFSDLSSLVEETNTLITTALGSPDKAVYGDAGNKILATWDENCSTLNSFINIFDNWSLMAVSIANEYGELDTGTAKVEGTDVDAFKSLSGASKTTWLKTPEGAKNYTGSDNTYKNPENGNIVNESSNLDNRREVTYTVANGNKITEYYNLAGVLIGTKKNGQLYDANGKKVSKIGTEEELAREENIKKAQESLKDSVKTKHEEKAARDEERKKKMLESSEYAIEPHSRISEEERQRRLKLVGGERGSKAEQDAKMVTIDVPYWNGSSESTFKITVNKAISENVRNVFKELTKLKYTVLPKCTGAYDYNHTPRPSGAPSDHTLGTAIDINWDHNWYKGDGSSYSVRGKEDVIKAFAKQGFYWGGDWHSSKDDMHFCFTGY